MLIGLMGAARSGKDTAAEMLQEARPNILGASLSFAEPMKQAVSELFDIPMDQLNGIGVDREQPHPVWGFSIREILQKFGTECMRDVFMDDFWLRRMAQELNTTRPQDLTIITDVRFDNEAEFVKQRGGILVGILRPDTDFTPARAHRSEDSAQLIAQHAAHTVLNDGTLEDFGVRLKNLLDSIE